MLLNKKPLKIAMLGMLLWAIGQLFMLPYFAFASPSAVFVSQFGGHDKASLMKVLSMARNPISGKIYTVDYNDQNHILIYNADGTYSSKFLFSAIDTATMLDIASNGDVYVTSNSGNKVYQFDQDGNLIRSWGTFGNGDGQFQIVNDIKYSSYNDRVYVSDSTRIQVFDLSGNFIESFIPSMNSPFIAISPVDGTVYSGDSTTNSPRIKSFNPDGNLITSWGTTGSGDGQFGQQVGGLAVDASGKVYAIDNGNHRVQVFQSNGTFVNKFGTVGTGDGQFDSAAGLMVLPSNGDIYVADNVNSLPLIRHDRVEIFDSSYAYKSQYQNSIPPSDGKFEDVESITVDTNGDLYVTDAHNDRVQVFDKDGNFLRKWGTSGTGNNEFDFPAAIAISPVNDHVYVMDGSNKRVQVFDKNGTFLSAFGSSGSGDGQMGFSEGITVDLDGNIYIADEGNDRVDVFDKDGNFLRKWGSGGTGDGQFDFIDSIVYSPVTDQLYVMDGSNYRVQVFDKDGNFVKKWGSNGSGDGEFGYSETITIDEVGNIYVTDSENDRVQVFDKDGNFLLKWGSHGSGNMQFDYVLAAGVHDGNVYVSDWAGGNGNSIRRFALDLVAQPPVISSPTDNESVSGSLTTVSGTSEANADVTVKESGSTICTATADGSGNWTCTLSPTISSAGTHTITVSQEDVSGNISADATRTFSIAANTRSNVSGSIPNGGGGKIATIKPETTPSQPVIAPIPAVCTPYFTSKAHYSSTGTEVLKIQQFLLDKGFYHTKVTGFFGSITRQAVKLFQQSYSADILVPLHLTAPTGNWAFSTMSFANKLVCTK